MYSVRTEGPSSAAEILSQPYFGSNRAGLREAHFLKARQYLPSHQHPCSSYISLSASSEPSVDERGERLISQQECWSSQVSDLLHFCCFVAGSHNRPSSGCLTCFASYVHSSSHSSTHSFIHSIHSFRPVRIPTVL